LLQIEPLIMEGVSEQGVRTIFGPKREKVAEIWRRLLSEELHNIHTSNIIKMIISRRMRWADGRDEKCIQCFSWKT